MAADAAADRLLFVNAAQVVTCAGPRRGRRGAEMADAVVRTGVAVLVEGGVVREVGDETALRRSGGDARCRASCCLPVNGARFSFRFPR